MKRMLVLLLSVLLLSACAAGGQAPAPEPSAPPESPSPAAEPAPAPSSESAPEVSSSRPEPSSVSEPESSSVPEESSQPEKEPVPAPEPDGLPLPPQGEVNPDFGFGPDFGDENYADVVLHRADPLWEALETALASIQEDYSDFEVWVEDGSLDVVLEIGVIHEDKVDQFLAAWTGPAWDRVEKRPGSWPVADQEAFVAAVGKLDLGPGVILHAQRNLPEDSVLISIGLEDAGASQEEVNRWSDLPQRITDLAKEMGVPEDKIGYIAPRYRASGMNPD